MTKKQIGILLAILIALLVAGGYITNDQAEVVEEIAEQNLGEDVPYND